jgi:acyl-CoA synthetase (AMP-forming)/AMP-acid ligase II
MTILPLSLLTYIERSADNVPNKIALIDAKKDTKVTYRTLFYRIQNVAQNLRLYGVQPGDRVLFSVRPNVEGLTFALGFVLAGAALVFADLGNTDEQFKAHIAKTKPDWVATESILYLGDKVPAFKRLLQKRGLNMPPFKEMERKGDFYAGSFSAIAPKNAKPIKELFQPTHNENKILADSMSEAVIVFTSGTTGSPKTVVHTQSTITAGIKTMIKETDLTTRTVLYTDHFMYGIAALAAGSTWVLPSKNIREDLKVFVNETKKYKPTHTFLVPADIRYLIDKKYLNNISFTTLVTGSAPVTKNLLQAIRNCNPKITTYAIYGMTEVLPIAITPGSEKLAYTGEGDLLGKVIPGITVNIENNEIVITSHGVMNGYAGEESYVTTDEGRTHKTGDYGMITDDKLVFLGRKKDMLIRGNRNIYPSLYEPHLVTIPGVKDTMLVGVPDIDGNDIVVLFVEPEPDFDAKTVEHNINKDIEKVFDYTAKPDHIFVIPEFIYNGRSLKPDRAQMRTKAAQMIESRK